MFQSPANETAELEAFMPNVNEVSRDFSVRIRSNTLDSAGELAVKPHFAIH